MESPWRETTMTSSTNDQHTFWGSMRARELLGAPLERALHGSLQTLKIPYRATTHWGQLEAFWIEFPEFFRDVLGICIPPHRSECLDWWAGLARSCFWWWPFDGICVVSERPAEIHSPDGQRLHHDSGPAVRFRDGWSIWAIGGVLVDEQVVLHPETQSVHEIRSEQNAEVKRIRIERFGWDRYLTEVGAVAIDRRRNDVEATLRKP